MDLSSSCITLGIANNEYGCEKSGSILNADTRYKHNTKYTEELPWLQRMKTDLQTGKHGQWLTDIENERERKKDRHQPIYLSIYLSIKLIWQCVCVCWHVRVRVGVSLSLSLNSLILTDFFEGHGSMIYMMKEKERKREREER